MSPAFHVTCSFILTYGVPMAFAAREIWTLRRDRGGWREDPVPAAPTPKPLPDCLIPKPGPYDWELEDERELELV